MNRQRCCLFVYIFALMLTFQIRVFASPVVWLTTVGGDSKTNSGFTITVTSINVGDEIKIAVYTTGGDLIEEFSEVAENPFIDRRFLFSESGIKGDLNFKVNVKETEVYNQNHRVFTNTGATDGQNAGQLSALLDKSLYKSGEEANLTVTLTGIEQYAYGSASIVVTGAGMTLLSDPTMPIANNKAVGTFKVKFDDVTLKSFNVEASWGGRGYTASVVVPVTMQQPEPESKYRLTTRSSPSSAGSTTGGGSYSQGEIIRIKATPSSRYEFDRWELSGNGYIANRYSQDTKFTVESGDAVVTAIFTLISTEKDRYNLYVEADTGGRVNNVDNTYREDSRVRIEAYPDQGYKFDRWKTSRGGSFDNSSNATTYFTMPANNVTVTATFIKEIILNKVTTVADSGGVLVTDRTGEYEEGTQLSLAAIPNNGYVFSHWTTTNGGTFGDSNVESTVFTTPNKETVVTAIFKPTPKVTLTIKTVGSGSTSGSGDYIPQTEVGLSATPLSGFVFKEWRKESGDITLQDINVPSVSLTMGNENVVLVAVFEEISAPEPEPEPLSPSPVIVEASKPQEKPAPIVLPKTSSITIGTSGLGILAMLGLIIKGIRKG